MGRKLTTLALMAVLLSFSACIVSTDSANSIAAEDAVVGQLKFDGVICCGASSRIKDQSYLFLITSGGSEERGEMLHILTADADGAPTEISALPSPVASPLNLGMPSATMAIVGDVVYIPLTTLAEETGFWVVDVSNPAAPQDLGIATSPDISASITSITAYRQLAVAATAMPASLPLFDISDPNNPQQIGTYQRTPVSAVNMLLDADLLVISDLQGVEFVDVSTPGSPRQVGFAPNPDWENFSVVPSGDAESIPDRSIPQIARAGNYLYVTESVSGLRILDISDPANPHEIDQVKIPDTTRAVIAFNDDLYTLSTQPTTDGPNWQYSVHVLDASDPASPNVIRSVDNIAGIPPFESIIASESYLYFLNNDTLQVIDTSGE